MGKLLLLIVFVVIAMAWFRARARQEAAESGEAGTRQAGPERMVACVRCGLHLPASEAVFDAAGTAYCGAPHLEAARAAK